MKKRGEVRDVSPREGFLEEKRKMFIKLPQFAPSSTHSNQRVDGCAGIARHFTPVELDAKRAGNMKPSNGKKSTTSPATSPFQQKQDPLQDLHWQRGISRRKPQTPPFSYELVFNSYVHSKRTGPHKTYQEAGCGPISSTAAASGRRSHRGCSLPICSCPAPASRLGADPRSTARRISRPPPRPNRRAGATAIPRICGRGLPTPRDRPHPRSLLLLLLPRLLFLLPSSLTHAASASAVDVVLALARRSAP